MSAATAIAPSTSTLPEGHWIDEDGYQIDDQGEVIGFVGQPDAAPARGPFRVHDRESAEWVMERIAAQEDQIASIRRRAEIVLANLKRQEKQATARLDGLHRRFDAELEQYARAELAGKKLKTLTLDNGRISFRVTKGSAKVVDHVLAIQFLRTIGYGSVVKVVESINTSDLAKVVDLARTDDERAEGRYSADILAFFQPPVPGENVTITAGILE